MNRILRPRVSHRIAAAAVAAACLLVLATAPGCRAPAARSSTAEPAPARIDDQRRALHLRSFDVIWETIRDRHWDPAIGGLDWQAVRDELRPRVESAATDAEARDAMQSMLGRLELSHFAVIPGDVYEQIDEDEDSHESAAAAADDRSTATAPSAAAAPGAAGSQTAASSSDKDEERGESNAGDDGDIGIDVRVLDGRAVVTRVDPGPAGDAGVRAGWIVASVDEVDLSRRMESISRRVPGGEYLPLLQAAAARRALRGPVGSTARLTFIDADEQTIELALTRVQRSGRTARFGNLPRMYVDFRSQRLDENVGYIAVSAFFEPGWMMPRFRDAVQSFLDCDGVILDLRGNPGGIGAMAMGMASWFVSERNHRLGTLTTRDSSLHFNISPRPRTFDGPLVILVDELSASTAEIFAGGMQDIGRARVVGTRTLGAALPSTVERLPNGDGFQYAIANYVSSSGRVLEGNGVAPDEEVRLTREALLAGRDPVIDAAVAWIRSHAARAQIE